MNGFLEYIKAAFLFVTVAVVSSIVVLKVSMYTGGEEILAPNVRGQTIVKALETLDQHDLYLKVARQTYHQDVAKDRIISQTPEAGAPIKRGRDVKVVISKGTKTRVTPELVDTTERGLVRLLADAELRANKVIQLHMEGTEKGVTLAQSPPPGSFLHRGGEVTVLVSEGPPPRYVMVPDLADKNLEQAMMAISELDLKVSEVAYRPDLVKAKGTVLSHDPPFGRRVEKGSGISLAVSEGTDNGASAAPTYTIFFYTIPSGPDPVNISIIQKNAGGEKEVYNRVHMPGDTVSLLVEIRGKTSAKVFLNNKLSDVKRF
ncbi:MAG: PASTA domain-containing protein [Nitrospinota bacterium]|nr:PASTA domain-containing protein [Nitrospinota bacterium]